MLIRTPWKKDYSYLCMWMTSNWLERNKTLIRCGKYSIKKLIWENKHLSLIMYTWVALKENVKQAKILLTITQPCLDPEFPQEQLKNYRARKICVFLRGHMTWKVIPRNVFNDILSWVNKTTQQLYKVSTPCIDDHHFKGGRIEIRRRIAKSMLSNCSDMPCTWHVLEDPIFHGQRSNLHDRSQNGPKLVTNDYLV